MLEKNLAAARLMTAEGDEKRKTVLRVGSAEPEAPGSTFYPFFTSSIVAVLVPPFSDFFYAVLQHYGLQAFHLHPNSILLLSIFVFYCKAYVVVIQFMALLRHFFFSKSTTATPRGAPTSSQLARPTRSQRLARMLMASGASGL